MNREQWFARHGRFALAALFVGAGCTGRATQENVPVVAFDAVVAGARAIPLDATADETALQTGALVTSREVIVLDEGRATVEAFARDNGRRTRTIAEPGDGPGDVRHPRAIASLDSSSYVIFDTKRGVLSFRDSAGVLRGETPVPPGFYGAMVPLLDARRVLLAGRVYQAPQGVRGHDLHEVDYSGKLLASYGDAVEPKSRWETTFSTLSATQIGTTVATVMLSSNQVRLYNRATGQARTIDVAKGWYVPLDWPSDRELTRAANPQGTADRVTKWAHSHLLINGLFALGGDRLVVRFQTFNAAGERTYQYAIADTTGRTLAVTQATTARVVATAGDTLFWLARRPGGSTEFGLGVASASGIARALGAGSASSHLAVAAPSH